MDRLRKVHRNMEIDNMLIYRHFCMFMGMCLYESTGFWLSVLFLYVFFTFLSMSIPVLHGVSVLVIE